VDSRKCLQCRRINSDSPVWFKVTVSRPGILVNSTGHYYTAAQPTYAEYDVSQIVNVKVWLLILLLEMARRMTRLVFRLFLMMLRANRWLFSAPLAIICHTYLLIGCLFPLQYLYPNRHYHGACWQQAVGEAFTQLSASGTKFKGAKNPRPMIKVGNVGDTGVGRMQDFMFTVADILSRRYLS
jgi:glucan 1,3-beta-glucosidase